MPSVKGTYFFSNNEDAIVWHTLDQVLYRPSLRNIYPSINVYITTKIGQRELLVPKSRTSPLEIVDESISDHLPIFISLET
jgi:hypothetical protein